MKTQEKNRQEENETQPAVDNKKNAEQARCWVQYDTRQQSMAVHTQQTKRRILCQGRPESKWTT